MQKLWSSVKASYLFLQNFSVLYIHYIFLYALSLYALITCFYNDTCRPHAHAMNHIELNALSYICVVLPDQSSFFFFFLQAPVSVYRSKQATEISLWIPVYGLPPHMFAVSLRKSRAGNERLLLRRETQAFYLSPTAAAAAHLSRSTLPSVVLCSPACFPTNGPAGKHDASLSWGGCCGVLEQQRCFSVWLSDTPTAHTGPAGLDPGTFQVLSLAKHWYDNKPSVCFCFYVFGL